MKYLIVILISIGNTPIIKSNFMFQRSILGCTKFLNCFKFELMAWEVWKCYFLIGPLILKELFFRELMDLARQANLKQFLCISIADGIYFIRYPIIWWILLNYGDNLSLDQLSFGKRLSNLSGEPDPFLKHQRKKYLIKQEMHFHTFWELQKGVENVVLLYF